jgi:hypothetical protein
MRRLITIGLAVLACVSLGVTSSSGQSDVIALYGDTMRTDCAGYPEDDMVVLYIFHYSPSGATGSQFRIAMPACLEATGEIIGPSLGQPAYPSTGNLKTGITFQYGVCLTGWIYVATFAYYDIMGLGGFGACCEQPVLAHPAASTGQVEAFDCQAVPRVALGVSGMVTTVTGCSCSTPTGIPNQDTSWGSIKELYGHH